MAKTVTLTGTAELNATGDLVISYMDKGRGARRLPIHPGSECLSFPDDPGPAITAAVAVSQPAPTGSSPLPLPERSSTIVGQPPPNSPAASPAMVPVAEALEDDAEAAVPDESWEERNIRAFMKEHSIQTYAGQGKRGMLNRCADWQAKQ